MDALLACCRVYMPVTFSDKIRLPSLFRWFHIQGVAFLSKRSVWQLASWARSISDPVLSFDDILRVALHDDLERAVSHLGYPHQHL